MRRVLIAILGLALTGIFVVSSNPAPAGAAITCTNQYHSLQWHQGCNITSSRTTGEWDVSIDWHYRHAPTTGGASQGTVNIWMNDRDTAYCTATRIRFRPASGINQTVWLTACNGSTKLYDVTLNTVQEPFWPADAGHYYVDFCDGKRPASCIQKWSVDVADTRP
jgi:hypothetical protein